MSLTKLSEVKTSGSETSRSKKSRGQNAFGTKFPGLKKTGIKRPGPKCQGSKRPDPKKSGGETSWVINVQVKAKGAMSWTKMSRDATSGSETTRSKKSGC